MRLRRRQLAPLGLLLAGGALWAMVFRSQPDDGSPPFPTLPHPLAHGGPRIRSEAAAPHTVGGRRHRRQRSSSTTAPATTTTTRERRFPGQPGFRCDPHATAGGAAGGLMPNAGWRSTAPSACGPPCHGWGRPRAAPRGGGAGSSAGAQAAPIAGGQVQGFAMEAVTVLTDLSKVADVRLVATYVDPDWVATLPHPQRSLLERLIEESYQWGLPPPHVFVSQWSPPELEEQLANSGIAPDSGTRVVSRTMYEADGLPARWLGALLRSVDEIWTPSRWNARIFGDSGGLPPAMFRVLGEGIDLQRFDPTLLDRARARDRVFDRLNAAAAERSVNGSEAATAGGISESTFVFLSIFKWEVRKGWPELIEAFLAEFAHDEDVVLVLRTSPESEEFAAHLESLCDSGAIECPHGAEAVARDRVRVLGSVSETALPTLCAVPCPSQPPPARADRHPSPGTRPRTHLCCPPMARAGAGPFSRPWRWGCR